MQMGFFRVNIFRIHYYFLCFHDFLNLGLLALEGELTPILVQMVKSANTNGLLDNDCDPRDVVMY